MTDIEKAIQELKELQKEIFDTAIIDKLLSIRQAIQALQEKAEREKGCATCNKSNLFIKQHKFPYCPMCGRKLGENK